MGDYYAGQRVVCIDDEWSHREEQERYGLTMPKKGTVYTVRTIGPSLTTETDELYIRLAEISNPVISRHGATAEPHFNVNMFRPLAEKRIDVFRAMLAPQPLNLANYNQGFDPDVFKKADA